ncbi:ubiquitin-conjugating enzyme E2 7 isoform X2 [Nicotiana tabacum]|uniref:Ubiquitin-conjugating enzyme E2 7 isoform X2 n=2 Tax=Nicotiana TaxID=4085 RepID=A0A1S3ZA43_TOBAC|nr:PREDICTED: ubiquitin-conjugating enzyme E2 7 isoform X2 [Nicotiana sylvestris]XP_016461248.1 PREDICTED: ubiquitin-conjugating enzyme E2 7 isoform X2 [Nicotiana tabacum]
MDFQLVWLMKATYSNGVSPLLDPRILYNSVDAVSPMTYPCLSEGGFFNAIMSFPQNYPNSPPTIRFTSEVWHPNVYSDGKVCISILHPPGDDPNGYELASERWSPVHTVESIILSIISMLSSPNDESPANVEAAKEWRDNRDEFKKKVSRCVRRSQEMT